MSWQETFLFKGQPLFYNLSEYNNFGERAVEVPIAIHFLNSLPKDARILEVGNVLAYYPQLLPEHHSAIQSRKIIDKFEVYPGVENFDLMALSSLEKYDAIASISTVEHIGQGVMPSGAYGEKIAVRDLEAPLKAIAKIYDLLRVGGQALITVPYGKLMDVEWLVQFSQNYLELLTSHYEIPEQALVITIVKRVAMELLSDCPRHLWVECESNDAKEIEWNWPWPFANAIAAIEMTKLPEPFNLNLEKISTPFVYHQPLPDSITSPLKEETFFILDQLRPINLIVFINWLLPEELVLAELEEVLTVLSEHPDLNLLSLLIDTSNIEKETAEVFLSYALMNICLKQELELKEELFVLLLGTLHKIQWQAILPRINYRIIVKYENQEAIANARAETLPTCELQILKHQQVIQLPTGLSTLQ